MGDGKALLTLLGIFCLFIYGIISLFSHIGNGLYDKKMAWENGYLEKIGMLYTNVLNTSSQCYTLPEYENLLKNIINFVNPQVRFTDKNVDNAIIIKMFKESVDNNIRNNCSIVYDKNYKENDILFLIIKTLNRKN